MRNDLRRHKGKPETVLRFVLGNEIPFLSREAEDGLDCRFTLDQREGALVRVTVGFRHPAAVHKHRPAIDKAEGRDDVKAGIALEGAASHEDFASMVERARQREAAKLEVRRDVAARELNRRCSGTRFEIVDQLVFPLQPMNLPGAKPDQDKKRRQRKDGWPEKRTKFHLHSHLERTRLSSRQQKERARKTRPLPHLFDWRQRNDAGPVTRPTSIRRRRGTARQRQRSASTRQPPQNRNAALP